MFKKDNTVDGLLVAAGRPPWFDDMADMIRLQLKNVQTLVDTTYGVASYQPLFCHVLARCHAR